MRLRLERFLHLDTATIGRLSWSGGPTLYTIERPWLANKKFVSCIPTGIYELEWDSTGRIKYVPRLRDVPGRSQINIHTANWANQLHGCIAPGLSYSLKGDPMIQQSKEAMALIMEQVDLGAGVEFAKDGDALYDLDGGATYIEVVDFSTALSS